MFQFLDVLRQLGRRQLPIKAKIIEHALLRLPPLGHLRVVSRRITVPPGRGRDSQSNLNLLAFEAIEDGGVISGIKICALGMHPPFALVAHDPLLAVVAKVEVDLLAVEAEALLLVLPHAELAQIFGIVLVGEVVLAGLVGLTDLVAADVRIRLLLLLGGVLLG